MAQTSTRFALSVHILAYLAQHRDEAVTSSRLAQSAGANPAFIRRILGELSRAGLTQGRLGKGGGAMLARGPKKISLLDIYRAVESEELVAAPKQPSRTKPDGLSLTLPFVLGGMVHEAENAFFEALEGVTLKQVVKQIA